MILAIDVGNTNLVVGCLEGTDIVFSERIATDPRRTELQYTVELKVLLELKNVDPKQISDCIISSVVPPLKPILRKAVNTLLGMDPLFIGPGIKTGLNLQMDNPAQVGADLIVDAVAGIRKYGAPLIIIDMGTATTVSVVDEKKNYIGGMIIPGVNISLNALVSGTSQLPKISVEAPGKLIGKNTVDCMKAGILYSQASALDGIISRIHDEMLPDAAVVATGGLAGVIVPYCRESVIIDNDLTLYGLALIYEKNKRGAEA